MINEIQAYAFCVEDIKLIENYKEALNDPNETWVCHHKLGIGGDYCNSVDELKLMNLYFHRPAKELVFMKRHDHQVLHGSNRSEKTKKKLSENNGMKKKAVREKMSKLKTGKVFTQEHKANLSISHKNDGHSDKITKQCNKLSKLYKGKHWKLVDGKRVWF